MKFIRFIAFMMLFVFARVGIGAPQVSATPCDVFVDNLSQSQTVYVNINITNQLDLNALGLNERGNTSQKRTSHLIHTLILDAQEIRLRQEAIREIMPWHERIKEILEPDWGATIFSHFRGMFFHFDNDAPNILEVDSTEMETVLGRKGISSSLIGYRERAKSRRDFFSEIREWIELIKDAKSTRLIQFRSAFESLMAHKDLVKWLKEFEKTTAVTEHLRLVLQARNSGPNDVIQQLSRVYAEFMMYCDIANNAVDNGWSVFPTVLDQSPSGPELQIIQALPPRLSKTTDGSVQGVPNSIHLSRAVGRNLIITGPNAEGKSTYVRTAAQLLALAQMGSPVPAESMSFTPLKLLVYIHPKDNPAKGESLLMAEGRALWNDILLEAQKSPYSFVLMDEILPGTIFQIREDAERVFLKKLSNTGALSITATHNWATAELADERPDEFKNVHVEKFHVKPGPAQSLVPMYEGAIEALKRVGWSDDVTDEIRSLGEARATTD